MKRIPILPILALLAATGCNTTPPAPGQPSQVAIDVAIGLDATVPVAVSITVAQTPSTVPYFTAAALAIEGATSSGTYSPGALLAALDAIPGANQSGWQYARLAIVAGVQLYAGLNQSGVITAIDANYCLAHFAADIRMGMPPASVEAVKSKTAPARSKYAKIIKR